MHFFNAKIGKNVGIDEGRPDFTCFVCYPDWYQYELCELR
jgi:hypothetical protein